MMGPRDYGFATCSILRKLIYVSPRNKIRSSELGYNSKSVEGSVC